MNMSNESIYEQRPWLKQYPQGVPAEKDVPKSSMNSLFDQVTDKYRNKTAVIFYGNKITYGDLRDRVDRFATALDALGIKKGDVVALLLLNSPEFIIAFYGCLKVGAIVSSISPVYVSSEIKHQIEDSGAKTIVCQDILWENVARADVDLTNVIMTNISDSFSGIQKMMGKSILREVYQRMAVPPKSTFEKEGFYHMADLIKKHQPKPPIIIVNVEEDIVALPYTGGTTGRPKGVMLTHYNHVAAIISMVEWWNFLEEGKEVTVSYQPFYHAAGCFAGVQMAILRGWTQVIYTTPDLDDIIDAVLTHKATYFQGAPTIYELLKDYEKTNHVNWKAIKIIVSAADSLHEATARDWEARTGTIIYDYWGMTETSALGCGTPIGKRKIGSCGVPVTNMIAGIANPETDEFMPQGELGELVVYSPSITIGYWKRPDATRDSQAVINGKTWWRTGDIMRMDEDGFFWFYDRKRDLIKYKGLRVYAREVEEVLKLHPSVKEAGVIGVADKLVGENVKAYVVLEADARGKVMEEDMIELCKSKLAHYKVPRIIEFVGEIPRTDIGKVSRRELRDMEE
jgi:long-chain acyl-CoA synthetase